MILPYPRGRVIDQDELYYWFEDIRRKRVEPSLRPHDVAGFSANEIIDDTLFEWYLNDTISVGRGDFKEVVRGDDGMDAFVLFYTTEVINFS